MKVSPIIFSAPMVLALLDGRKTQTRRLATRPARPYPGVECKHGFDACPNCDAPRPSEWTKRQPGDVLWVRESFFLPDAMLERRSDAGLCYRADVPGGSQSNIYTGWRPSIHMPRWLSRLTLTITDVRRQRLVDIDKADTISEGLKCLSKDGGQTHKYGLPDRDGLPGNDDYGWHWVDWHVDPLEAFKTLWDRVHGEDAWAEMRYAEIVALTFTVRKQNVDELLRQQVAA